MPWTSFLKDVLFVQLILGFIILFNIHGRIDAWMGLSFLALYVLYVVATLVLAKPQKKETSEGLEAIDSNDTKSPLNDDDSEE